MAMGVGGRYCGQECLSWFDWRQLTSICAILLRYGLQDQMLIRVNSARSRKMTIPNESLILEHPIARRWLASNRLSAVVSSMISSIKPLSEMLDSWQTSSLSALSYNIPHPPSLALIYEFAVAAPKSSRADRTTRLSHPAYLGIPIEQSQCTHSAYFLMHSFIRQSQAWPGLAIFVNIFLHPYSRARFLLWVLFGYNGKLT